MSIYVSDNNRLAQPMGFTLFNTRFVIHNSQVRPPYCAMNDVTSKNKNHKWFLKASTVKWLVHEFAELNSRHS